MKIYYSPSTQERNLGVGAYGTEELRMNIIANYGIPELIGAGYLVARNKPEMTLNQVIAESKGFNPDIHIEVHSNAGGGQGTEVWYDSGNAESKRLAECVYKHVAPLTPGNDRGIKDATGQYGALRDTNAKARIILEIGFHDNWADAEHIVNYPQQIAKAINQGIFEYAGLQPNNVHVLEFSPDAYKFDVDIGTPGKLETVSQIVKMRNAHAGINLGFFDMSGKAEHYSLLMRNGKIENPPNFAMECWLKDGKLTVQDIQTNSQVPLDADWAVGLSFSLILNGKKDIRNFEKFPHYKQKEPRTAIGQKANGNIVLVAVDAPGMTADELANYMLSLGCVVAVNADGGGSTTMVKEGKVINKPEYSKERSVGSVLLVYPKAQPISEEELAMQKLRAAGIVKNDHDFDSSVTWREFAITLARIMDKCSQ